MAKVPVLLFTLEYSRNNLQKALQNIHTFSEGLVRDVLVHWVRLRMTKGLLPDHTEYQAWYTAVRREEGRLWADVSSGTLNKSGTLRAVLIANQIRVQIQNCPALQVIIHLLKS